GGGAGGAGDLPRRDARIHQDGPRPSRGAPVPPGRGGRAALRLFLKHRVSEVAMQRQDFRCLLRLRVRWSEVDPQGIVFNAHYLSYADCAIAEYWRRLGLPYAASMQALQGDVYVKKASTLYHASARLDDWLDVGKIGR